MAGKDAEVRPEEVFRFTANQRAELDAGFAQILADREARAVEDALSGLLVVCVDKAPERERMYDRSADHPARTGVRSNSAVRSPVRRMRKGRSAARQAYDRVASFAGALMVIVISGSIGLFLGATLTAR
ncbi:hypothetical protein [Streptomyces sp. NPDC002054]|uniref:hypothetical protein n=1 Tax=Streptomyces sp. NPDC002054 TaxID=3154663 RepID=UPI00331D2E79